MEKYRFLILGAGISGLTLASHLQKIGETSFLVLEKEACAGGLCRSVLVDGSPLDIGGGHVLDVRNETVNNFVFDYLPAGEWNRFERVSKIRLKGFEIDYPFEANIWQLPVDEQIGYLVSLFSAGCNQGHPKPERFSEWIPWKLGEKIARDYLLPYNQKIFSVDLHEVNTEWLHKLPDISIHDTLRSCLLRQPSGNLPAHSAFLYPKHYGFGEFCVRISQTLGNRLRLNTPVTSLDFEKRLVNNTYRSLL